MADAKTLIDVVKEAVAHFKAGDYEKVQDLLRGKAYAAAMQAEPEGKLKNAVLGLYKHMVIATTPQVSARLSDDILKTMTGVLETFENSNGSRVPHSSLIKSIDTQLHKIVSHLSGTMQQQANALTEHEEILFNDEGPWSYGWDLVKSRWGGKHHTGDKVEIKVSEVIQAHALKAPLPSLDPIAKSFHLGGLSSIFDKTLDNQLGANENVAPISITPQTQLVDKTIILEGKALEEFGNVTLLDNGWKKAGAAAATLAGVGIVAHGVRNVYLSIKPDANQNLEVADLGHEKQQQGEINWLRMMVGASEIGVGGFIMARQITGRNPLDLNSAVKGSFTALCNHGDAPPLVGRS